MITSPHDIQEANHSFAGCNRGGDDGLRPIHIQDSVSNQTAEADNSLIFTLTFLVNTFLNEQVKDIDRILFLLPISLTLRKNMAASAK